MKKTTLIATWLALLSLIINLTPNAPLSNAINPALAATVGNLLPDPRLQFFTSAGVVLSSGGICTYAAGTTTPLQTFTDQTLATPAANPIVLDSGGTLQTNIYTNALSYKMALLDSTNRVLAQSFGCGALGVSFSSIWTADNIQGAAGTSANVLTGNLPYAQMPTGSGTWTAMPTITGPVIISSGSASALTVTGGSSVGAGGMLVGTTGIVTNSVQARADAFNNAVQSVPDTTVTVLTLNSERFNVGAMHSTSVNTSRLTVPSNQAGLYWVYGWTNFAANATGRRRLIIKKNGSVTINDETLGTVSAANVSGMQIGALLVLAAGDFVELYVQQTSGGNLNVGDTGTTDGDETELTAVRIW